MADAGRGGPPADAASPVRPSRPWSSADLAWLLLLLSALGVWGQVAGRQGRPAAAPGRDSVSVARAARALPALARLAAGDVDTVRVARASAPADALAPDSAAVGRVVAAPVASGAVLTRASLVTLPGEWWAVGLPADSALPLRVGDGVALLGDSSVAARVQGVVLGTRGGKVLIAVSAGPAAARAFADSVFRLAYRIPPEVAASAADTPVAVARGRAGRPGASSP